MAAMGAGEAIVRILEAEGVKAVFGIPGGHTLPGNRVPWVEAADMSDH